MTFAASQLKQIALPAMTKSLRSSMNEGNYPPAKPEALFG
jgi:hypothetical protein